jgi:Ca2+-binding EF-hand superfamily protein
VQGLSGDIVAHVEQLRVEKDAESRKVAELQAEINQGN